MFSRKCLDAITSRAAHIAQWLYVLPQIYVGATKLCNSEDLRACSLSHHRKSGVHPDSLVSATSGFPHADFEYCQNLGFKTLRLGHTAMLLQVTYLNKQALNADLGQPPILGPICQQVVSNGIGYGPNADSNPFPSECAPYFEHGHNSLQDTYPTADGLSDFPPLSRKLAC